MSKPQVYLNATQERLQSWKNCKRQHKTLNFRGMSSVSSGTWSAGPHGRVSCRAKVPRRPHWSSVCHIRNVGWLHKGRQVEHKPSGKSREEEVGRCPTSTHKHCPGTRGEEAKTQLEAATGQEVPLHQQQIKDQTKQALVTEKKNQEGNSEQLQDSFIPNLGKKMEQNLLDSISRTQRTKTPLQMARKIPHRQNGPNRPSYLWWSHWLCGWGQCSRHHLPDFSRQKGTDKTQEKVAGLTVSRQQ